MVPSLVLLMITSSGSVPFEINSNLKCLVSLYLSSEALFGTELGYPGKRGQIKR